MTDDGKDVRTTSAVVQSLDQENDEIYLTVREHYTGVWPRLRTERLVLSLRAPDRYVGVGNDAAETEVPVTAREMVDLGLALLTQGLRYQRDGVA